MDTNPVKFKNEFGALTLTPVTGFMPVSQISSKHPLAAESSFDMETAEKVALITGNRGIQLVLHYPLNNKAFVVLHDSPATAAICSASLEEFQCTGTPAEMLNTLNRGFQPA